VPRTPKKPSYVIVTHLLKFKLLEKKLKDEKIKKVFVLEYKELKYKRVLMLLRVLRFSLLVETIVDAR
jgi:hypothetical protein